MLESLQSLVTPAVMQRLTLLLNHVLSSEAVATQRLKPHAGRRVRLQVVDWPPMLPAWPPMEFAVTPAGLLEWQSPNTAAVADAAVPVDLTLTLQASNPAQMVLQALSGQKPRIDVSGNAAFAADMSWLMDNLRWDIRDDLARWVGQVPAQQLGRVGQGIAEALRGLAQRWASGNNSSHADASSAPVPPPPPPPPPPPAGAP